MTFVVMMSIDDLERALRRAFYGHPAPDRFRSVRVEIGGLYLDAWKRFLSGDRGRYEPILLEKLVSRELPFEGVEVVEVDEPGVRLVLGRK